MRVSLANDKMRAFKHKMEVWTTYIHHNGSDSFPVFSDEIIDDVNKCDILMLYNEMCQYLEDLHNLGN